MQGKLVIQAAVGLALAWTALSSAADSLMRIEVFTGRNQTVVVPFGMDARVYPLDAIERIQASLNARLPTDRAELQAALPSVLQQARAQAEQLRDAHLGLIKARQYGLDRLPAIVFDEGAAVVYGINDVAAAVAAYNQWRALAQGRRP